jgi:hypothetical protein
MGMLRRGHEPLPRKDSTLARTGTVDERRATMNHPSVPRQTASPSTIQMHEGGSWREWSSMVVEEAGRALDSWAISSPTYSVLACLNAKEDLRAALLVHK